uniref:Uncharacterized protein n=1 Tax=Vitis vinifera TaxID=29760 RepID=A5AEW0_VITVI|nr:hypothetical protein VITISV_022178 [Vitis vinifera]
MSVANIGKLQENTAVVRARGLRNFTAKGQHFRSQRLISQPCNILPLAWSDLLAMAVTPSFQLRITHRKRYQRIRTCMTGEIETPFSPIRRQAPDVKYPEKVERQPDRIPDVRYPEKVERRPDRIPDVRYPEKVERRSDRIPDVRYPEKVERRPDRILPRVE